MGDLVLVFPNPDTPNFANKAISFKEALDIYEIDGKVSEVVTDNASNMTNAFKIPDGEENGVEDDEDSIALMMRMTYKMKLLKTLTSHSI